jgi:NhaA family Na+:H+ antiporter
MKSQSPVSKSTKLFKEFLDSEKAGGIILISCTLISLLWANSEFGDSYHSFWLSKFYGQSLELDKRWFNDHLFFVDRS